MPQAFIITGNIEFQGDQELLQGRVEVYERPFYLAHNMNLQAIENHLVPVKDHEYNLISE